MTPPYFLFCEALSSERLRWLERVLSHSPVAGTAVSPSARVFLTGDALYAMTDRRTRAAFHSFSSIPGIRIAADKDEIRLAGIPVETGARVVVPEDFWQEMVEALPPGGPEGAAAFLLCHGPYMSRIPVYMVRFLTRALVSGRSPELYLYLDGVHAGHEGQRPSEFANIGRAVFDLDTSARARNRLSWFGACSRCATARGYYVQNLSTGSCESSGVIPAVTVRPLREILGRFLLSHPVLSHGCGGLGGARNGGAGVPRLVVCLTMAPYLAEWTFGGLSLAAAAAMEGIPTTVIFIEDGVYSLAGTHTVAPEDRLFNVQEMVEATGDIDGLVYCAYSPSLVERGVSISEDLSAVRTIDEYEIREAVLGRSGDMAGPQVRLLFF